MEHFGNSIRSGPLGALDWFGEQDPDVQHYSINMGGPSPRVTYSSGNRHEINTESFLPPQELPRAVAPVMQQAVWHPGAGMASPAANPAIWNTAQQEAYPFLPVAAQAEGGQEGDTPYYRVGRRPLGESGGVGKIPYNDPDSQGNVGWDWNLRAEHQHFIGNNGSNFGFDKSGVFEEQNREKDYAYDIPGISTTKFKAKYMDMARLMVSEQMQTDKEKMQELIEAFSIEDGEYRLNGYHLLLNNCQDYVDKVISTARELAKRNGETLEIQ